MTNKVLYIELKLCSSAFSSETDNGSWEPRCSEAKSTRFAGGETGLWCDPSWEGDEKETDTKKKIDFLNIIFFFCRQSKAGSVLWEQPSHPL